MKTKKMKLKRLSKLSAAIEKATDQVIEARAFVNVTSRSLRERDNPSTNVEDHLDGGLSEEVYVLGRATRLLDKAFHFLDSAEMLLPFDAITRFQMKQKEESGK